ncbi:MAG TPA: hypothetical protein DDW52_29205 [Planctomycetaceae bacterium]|nr:hypothetical protein [Planctomycetaceae bacterium]
MPVQYGSKSEHYPRCPRSPRWIAENTRLGTIYIAVLGASVLVALLSLTAMHVARNNLRNSQALRQRDTAAMLAQSGVEHALAMIESDPSWRSNFQSGVSNPAQPLAQVAGSYTWQIIDLDGNLGDDLADSAVVRGIGVSADAIHTAEVVVQPVDRTPITSLQSAFHSNGPITTGIDAFIRVNKRVSSNTTITANALLSYIDGDAEAYQSVTGNIFGQTQNLDAPLQMPDSTVFSYYIQMGTQIDMSQLAYDNRYEFKNVVLSPASNPWGETNPEGIYILDCKGQELRICDCRVVGTLVVLNPGPATRIERTVLFEPAIVNFPSLLVDGSIAVLVDSIANCNETRVNFNPVGTPYNGVEDNDRSDKYPSQIRGLVYVSGTIDFFPDFIRSDFVGCVICGSVHANSDFSVHYQSRFADYPPPGFSSGSQMQIVPGSWRRSQSQ